MAAFTALSQHVGETALLQKGRSQCPASRGSRAAESKAERARCRPSLALASEARGRPVASNNGHGRRALFAGTAVNASVLLLTDRPALGYGLNYAPPQSESNQKKYVDVEKLREEADRRREEKEAENNRGELVTLPSGIQYRELEVGTGKEVQRGATCYVLYTVYRLASGAYFKYSSGGTPVFLWSRGYGAEGQDDVGDPYRFVLGEPNTLPRAVVPAMEGMRVGGKRRVLVPPQVGWTDGKVQPRPGTFGGGRRLENHRDEPLLMEVELIKARSPDEPLDPEELEAELAGNFSFKLPMPPNPFARGDKLPEGIDA